MSEILPEDNIMIYLIIVMVLNFLICTIKTHDNIEDNYVSAHSISGFNACCIAHKTSTKEATSVWLYDSVGVVT